MKRMILLAVFLSVAASMAAGTFQVTGYIPSYRLESAERATGSPVLDLSAFSPDYSSNRTISQDNLEFSYNDLPPAYEYADIESWYGKNVDNLIYFSVKPDENGSLDSSDAEERDLARLKNISHLYGTDLTLAVSGTSSHFAPVAADGDKRERFLNELVDYCRDWGFTGIDFDWEYPKDQDQIDNFHLLIEEALSLFEPLQIRVSAAVSRFKPLNQEIYDSLNSINLMAYDNYGRHSTYESAVEAAEYLQIRYKVPPEKINLGIPFYGRIFSGLDPQYWTKTKIYRHIREDYSLSPSQDEAGGFYFNGLDTVRKKTAYAMEQGLGGVMIWELGQDSFDEYSLLRAIREEIK